jgi:hypothetical protein
MSPILEELADQACDEVLIEEVSTMTSKPEIYAHCHFLNVGCLPFMGKLTTFHPRYPVLISSYDKGWQKRSSGRDYDSTVVMQEWLE